MEAGKESRLITMRIYLCDHLWNRFGDPPSAWHQAFVAAFGEIFVSSAASNDNTPPRDHAAYGDSNSVLFAHSEHPEEWRLRADASEVACHIVLIRTYGGEGPKDNVKGNFHGCYWGQSDFQGPTRPSRMSELIRQVSTGDTSEVTWDLLQPDPSEPLLAAKLIVEAKVHAGKTLHGLAIGPIPDDLLGAAEAVVKVDSTDTKSLMPAIGSFEAILNRYNSTA